MRRTLYWKRLLIVLAVFLAVSGAVFGVHRVQLKSQVTVFKTRAEQAEAAVGDDREKRGEVIALYAKYLKFRPADEAAYQKYAHLLFEQAKADKTDKATTDRAVAGVEGFLRAFPAHTAERQQLAELYVENNKHLNARQHIEMLFSAPGGSFRTDIKVLEMAAKCERGLNDLPKAIAHLQAAIDTGRAPVEVYEQALVLNHANVTDPRRNANIAGYLRALLEEPRFRGNLSARVAAAEFQQFLGETQNARDNVGVALRMSGGSEDPRALLAAAEIEIAEIKTLDQAPAQLQKAAELLKKAHERDPKHLRVGALYAEVLSRQGKMAEGVVVLRTVAKNLPAVDGEYVSVVDLLIDLGDQTDAPAMADAVAASDTHKAFAPYLRGRLALLKKDYLGALRLFEEVAPKLTAVRLFHKKAMVGMAACYAALQNPDMQLEFCRRALRDDPGYPLAIVGEAEALVKVRKTSEALSRYREIVNKFQLVEYRPELARLEMLDVLLQPVEAERNWTRFEESLGPVADRTPEIHMIHARSLAMRNKAADGAKLLRDWLNANPKHPKAGAVSVALVGVGAGGTAEAALKMLETEAVAVGNGVDVRVARAALMVALSTPPLPADFDKLVADSAGFPKADQFRLWFEVGTAAGQVADLLPEGEQGQKMRAAAIRYLRTAADLSPSDLASRAALLDHALAAGRGDVVAQALKEIADVEGPNGPYGALGQIAIRLPKARQMTDPAQKAAEVKELRALAVRARDLRGGLGRVYVALAYLDEMDLLTDAALANYRAAIDNGERQEFVIRRAVYLYREKKQDDQAVAMLNKLSTLVRLPEDLERYRAVRDLMLSPELPKNSRQTIDRIAPAVSKDYRLQLLRGALLASLRAEDDALAAFREAVSLNGRSVETWTSLVGQLIRTGQPGEAKEAVTQAEKALKGVVATSAEAQSELLIGVAALFETVGDLPAALNYYTAATKADATGINPLKQLVQFYQRTGQGPKADELLAQAKASPATDIARWARRHLALTLVSRPNAYAVRGDALTLLKQNLDTAPDEAEDRKARAVVLTVDPVTREEGINELRRYGDRGDLTPSEFYLLGRLAFDQGKFTEALGWFQKAARIRPGVTPEHLAALVRVYLVLPEQVHAAEAALERLKVNNPNSWEAVREEARLLAHKSKRAAALNDTSEAKKLIDQARALVVKFPGWDAGDNLATLSGPLFEELGLTADAEAAYKKFLETSAVPGAHQPLAVLYIRQKQPEKAIELAFAREKAPTLLTARLLTGAVRSKRPDAALEAKVEKWLEGALAKATDDPELEAALVGARAELYDARGDSAAAIKEYELSIAKFDRVARPRGSKDVVVNNLCMLLALTEDKTRRANDAVKMMTELIAIRGPVPSFLDTRAVAYLVSSRPAEAIKDLEMALIQFDRAAYHFHLAWAMDLDPLEAKRVLALGEMKKAKALGLTADDLHPIEFKKYEALLGKFLPKSN